MNIGKYNIDITDFSLLPWRRSDIIYDKDGIGTVINLRGWLFFVITDIENHYTEQ
tara:strand:- start:266 stop:430 length:165 start_codon:yes stop_codon:yes gene_type:complete